jgi:multiple sugar transport system permease protein
MPAVETKVEGHEAASVRIRVGALRAWIPWLFLAPAVVYLVLMTIYPLGYSLWASFHYFNLFRPNQIRYVGLGNFIDLFTKDFTFWNVIRITLTYTVSVVTIQFILGLLIALLMNRPMRGMAFVRTVFMIPILLSPVVVGLSWRYLYEPYGVVNALFGFFGLPKLPWVADVRTALTSVIVVDIWQWTPFVVLVLLAGIQAIPREVTEAGALDGLPFRHFFVRVLWPLLRPVALVVLLLRMMDALKVFDTIYMLTRGGPGTATYVASMYNYVLFFGTYEVGYAAAMSYVIVIIVNIFALLLIQSLGKES